jgi:hypothetical protein
MLALHRLMSVPKENRDRDWVIEGLQLAIELEWGTIPPYLYAWWSIDTDNNGDPDDVAGAFKSIFVEEMLHMSIVCNLLAGLSVNPKIASLTPLPTYPGKLTAGIHANLTIGLEPLSPCLLLKTFMVIEEPVTIFVVDPDFQPSGEKLIGQFYKDLQDIIVQLNLTFDPARQIDLSGFFGGAPPQAQSADDAKNAIALILDQGEGADGNPFPVGADNPSHFYRFGGIFHGSKLTRTAPFTYTGDPIRMPKVKPIPIDPVPVPAQDAFNRAYSDMLRLLENAWQNDASGPLFQAAFTAMPGLTTLAKALMNDPQQPTGPTFVYIPAPAPVVPVALVPVVPVLVPAPAPPIPIPLPVEPRFTKVKQILDSAVNGEDIHAHGPFWRGLTRDLFVAKSVFGQKLVVPGNIADSNLLKALRGQPPFGNDTGTMNVPFRRMPAGRPPVAPDDILFLEQWIADGCPDDPAPLPEALLSMCSGAMVTPEQHIAFWREFDDWAMFHVSDDVQTAEGAVFGMVGAWFAYAKDPAARDAWLATIQGPAFLAAATTLSQRQQQTAESSYGVPLPLLAVLDGFQQFGADTLPEDPLRPADRRHRMDGESMWFVWGAFAEACVTLKIAEEFWCFFTRAILCGLLNDGLLRGRYPVNGFAATEEGQRAILTFVQQVKDDDLPDEVRRRYRDSQL